MDAWLNVVVCLFDQIFKPKKSGQKMGQYVNSTLIDNEQVIHETHIHRIIFLFPSGILTLWLYPLIVRWSHEFAITNRRIVIKTGLIQRRLSLIHI